MTLLGELAVLFGLCLLCEGLTALLPFPLPGSVLSLLLLLVLLLTGVLKERHIGRVSAFFTGNMAFFFIPPCVGILEHWGTLSSALLPFLAIAIFTTPLVYAATGWTVQLVLALQRRGGSRR